MLIETVHWVGFALGLVLVGATWRSIINTIILPRTVTSNLTFLMWTVVHGVFHAAAGRRQRHEDRYWVLALRGPVSLLVMLAGWMLLFVLGFALLLWPLLGGGFRAALAISGSSFMTLGVAPAPPGPPTLLEYAAASTGMIVVALQIGYLPTIYGAYNRRETLILALRGRAGSPAWGPQILANHQQYHMMPTMPAFFAAWETWAADITKYHASYPWLMVFRSPEPDRSWVLSLLSVLDAAACVSGARPDAGPAGDAPLPAGGPDGAADAGTRLGAATALPGRDRRDAAGRDADCTVVCGVRPRGVKLHSGNGLPHGMHAGRSLGTVLFLARAVRRGRLRAGGVRHHPRHALDPPPRAEAGRLTHLREDFATCSANVTAPVSVNKV